MKKNKIKTQLDWWLDGVYAGIKLVNEKLEEQYGLEFRTNIKRKEIEKKMLE